MAKGLGADLSLRLWSLLERVAAASAAPDPASGRRGSPTVFSMDLDAYREDIRRAVRITRVRLGEYGGTA